MKKTTQYSKLAIATLATLSLGHYALAESPITEGRSGGDATKVIASPSPVAVEVIEESVVVEEGSESASGGRASGTDTSVTKDAKEKMGKFEKDVEKDASKMGDEVKKEAGKAKKDVEDAASKVLEKDKKVEGTTHSPNHGATSNGD